MNRIPIALGVLLLGGGIAAACSSSGSSGPSVSLTKAAPSNNNQSDTVTRTLVNRVRVLLTEDGSPKQGSTVTWAVTGGGPNAAIVPLSPTTDASGIAEATWTLGEAAGAQTVTASVTGASGSPQTFNATAENDEAFSFAKASGNNGDNQSGQINTALANPLRVVVKDQFGNGVDGESVDWVVTSEPGTGTSLNPNPSTTDANGVASTTVTLGNAASPPPVVVTASASVGSDQVFNLTATLLPPPPTSAAVTVGNNFFRSDHNGTSNPAIDTVAVNGTVTWTWNNTGATPHSVQSTGSPSFTSSNTKTGNGQTYQFQFPNANTYTYDCIVHGSAMTGRVVVR